MDNNINIQVARRNGTICLLVKCIMQFLSVVKTQSADNTAKHLSILPNTFTITPNQKSQKSNLSFGEKKLRYHLCKISYIFSLQVGVRKEIHIWLSKIPCYSWSILRPWTSRQVSHQFCRLFSHSTESDTDLVHNDSH